MADVNVTDLTQETYETLDGTEQFVMFDTVEGKRATITAVGEYVIKKLATLNSKTLQTILSEKVDVESGKGLSANDFTNGLKDKLTGIESGAEVNVQVDWSVSDSTSDAFIKNKPTIPPAVTVDSSMSTTSTNPVQNKVIKTALDGKVDTVSGKGLSANDFTTAYKEKLDGVSTGAEVNQNAFTNVKVGASTVQSGAKTDTLELIAGTNVTLTPDTTNKTVTFGATDTTYESKQAAQSGVDVSLVTTGEKYTWNNKISSHQTIKQDGVTGATVNRYAICDTSASLLAKTADVEDGTFSLETGARVTVNFTYTNTASNPTLNVNNTGAKSINFKGTQITSGSEKALLSNVVDLVYNGTDWDLIASSQVIDDITDAEIDAIVTGVTPGSFDALLDWCYPVGSYYETHLANFDPNNSWGGSWELDPDMSGGIINDNATSGTIDADLSTLITSWGIASDVASTNSLYRWHRLS